MKKKTRTIRTVLYRRKREGRTDYKGRLSLLKSAKARVVVRKTLRSTMGQLVQYAPSGDIVVCTVTVKDLQKVGWTYSGKNVSASYLLGLVLGKKALTKGIKEAVVDFGLQVTVNGGRLYAFVKGCVDAGLYIPCSEEVFPTEDCLKGKNLEAYVQSAKGIADSFLKIKEKLLSQ